MQYAHKLQKQQQQEYIHYQEYLQEQQKLERHHDHEEPKQLREQGQQLHELKKQIQELQQELQKHKIEKPSNPLSTINNLRLYQVFDSLVALKKAIINVNYLISLTNVYKDDIIREGQYASVLQPIIDKQYANSIDDFWITSVNPEWYSYFFNKYSFWNNKTLDEFKCYNNNNNLSDYNTAIDENIRYGRKYIANLKNQYTTNETYYYFSVVPWNNSLSLKINYFAKDLLNKSNDLSIGGRIDLSAYIPNTNDVANFSPEYLKFINDLAHNISVLNGNDWQTDAIWPYADPANFVALTCLDSTSYPEWNGKLISECFIPGSDFDYPSMMYGIMVDLFFNYPQLVPGQIALVTYNILDKYYLSFVKIDNFIDSNGSVQLCFKQKQIEINAYFSNLVSAINSDTLIKGSFNVHTYKGENIIKTDNIAKVTTFNNKIGINQDVCDVKGLLDIDNLSNNVVLNMMHDFVNPLLFSYEVTMELKDQVSYGQEILTNIPVSYSEDVLVFKAPIQNKITETDISFLYTPSTAFSSKKMDQTSFAKIIQIVNELNKMQPEIELNDETRSFIFSFVELLNDTNNYYLTSLRGIIKRDPLNLNREIYFVGSFLDVNDKMINNSYKKNMVLLTDKFSSNNRLLNFANLIILDPQVQDNLLQ
jgi:hypothetical protein